MCLHDILSLLHDLLSLLHVLPNIWRVCVCTGWICHTWQPRQTPTSTPTCFLGRGQCLPAGGGRPDARGSGWHMLQGAQLWNWNLGRTMTLSHKCVGQPLCILHMLHNTWHTGDGSH